MFPWCVSQFMESRVKMKNSLSKTHHFTKTHKFMNKNTLICKNDKFSGSSFRHKARLIAFVPRAARSGPVVPFWAWAFCSQVAAAAFGSALLFRACSSTSCALCTTSPTSCTSVAARARGVTWSQETRSLSCPGGGPKGLPCGTNHP